MCYINRKYRFKNAEIRLFFLRHVFTNNYRGLFLVLSLGAGKKRPWYHHYRDPWGAAVLLRWGLPPAVPEEGAERLLWPQRHRRLLSHWSREGWAVKDVWREREGWGYRWEPLKAVILSFSVLNLLLSFIQASRSQVKCLVFTENLKSVLHKAEKKHHKIKMKNWREHWREQLDL